MIGLSTFDLFPARHEFESAKPRFFDTVYQRVRDEYIHHRGLRDSKYYCTRQFRFNESTSTNVHERSVSKERALRSFYVQRVASICHIEQPEFPLATLKW